VEEVGAAPQPRQVGWPARSTRGARLAVIAAALAALLALALLLLGAPPRVESSREGTGRQAHGTTVWGLRLHQQLPRRSQCGRDTL
jgi:hypothetical protein